MAELIKNGKKVIKLAKNGVECFPYDAKNDKFVKDGKEYKNTDTDWIEHQGNAYYRSNDDSIGFDLSLFIDEIKASFNKPFFVSIVTENTYNQEMRDVRSFKAESWTSSMAINLFDGSPCQMKFSENGTLYIYDTNISQDAEVAILIMQK